MVRSLIRRRTEDSRTGMTGSAEIKFYGKVFPKRNFFRNFGNDSAAVRMTNFMSVQFTGYGQDRFIVSGI